MPRKGLIEKYSERLPLRAGILPVTLDEGDTPLVPAPRLAEWACPGCQLYLKLEGANPTGSFKDRGMTVALSAAVHDGALAVICASTGNTSASASAYAARAGIKCVVLAPAGKVALGKMAQAVMCGASIVEIEGNFDQALCIVRELSETEPYALVNSVNPLRLQGQKTVAFEVAEELGRSPDIHAMPVGNAGNISAAWLGYSELLAEGAVESTPAMLGYQASGAAPIVRRAPIENPETFATAIRIGNPASWKLAVAAAQESGGAIDEVSDEEILAAYRALASLEGVFVEPASATGVAGIRKRWQQGSVPDGAVIAVTLTGHGLKDPDTAVERCAYQPITAKATPSAVLRALNS